MSPNTLLVGSGTYLVPQTGSQAPLHPQPARSATGGAPSLLFPAPPGSRTSVSGAVSAMGTLSEMWLAQGQGGRGEAPGNVWPTWLRVLELYLWMKMGPRW